MILSIYGHEVTQDNDYYVEGVERATRLIAGVAVFTGSLIDMFPQRESGQ